MSNTTYKCALFSLLFVHVTDAAALTREQCNDFFQGSCALAFGGRGDPCDPKTFVPSTHCGGKFDTYVKWECKGNIIVQTDVKVCGTADANLFCLEPFELQACGYGPNACLTLDQRSNCVLKLARFRDDCGELKTKPPATPTPGPDINPLALIPTPTPTPATVPPTRAAPTATPTPLALNPVPTIDMGGTNTSTATLR